MKSIMLHVHADDALDHRLQVALGVCRAFGAHLTCLYAAPYNAYVTMDPLGGMALQAAIMDEFRETEGRVRQQVSAQMVHNDVTWDWQSTIGDVSTNIVQAIALADLVILSQYDGKGEELNKPLAIVDDVAVHASCATMVVPVGVSSFQIGGEIVIGWNASPEASHAVRMALPFLKVASAVHIASVEQGDEAFPQTAAHTYLSRHGVLSDLHELPRAGRRTAQVLHDFAISKGASGLVMGAYGHSRLRETLLGGVTRNLLATSTVPLLLGH
jgi:nucleotide-binding universal stress UspA family protein